MKSFLMLLIFSLTACANLKMEAPKYGEYRKHGCHWMGCSLINLSKSKVFEKYESDDLSENTYAEFYYIADRGFIKLHDGRKYYYWYFSCNVFGFFGSYLLTGEEIYQECKGDKVCMLPKSYRFHRKL